jgi:GNAT superfamily N-acetyltransferase
MPYPNEPGARAETLELLGRMWTKLPGAVVRARGWGVDWCEVSTPFVQHEAGRIVAHVGVLEIPVVLDGQQRTVAGIHAVCTHPDHRRRGHMRAAMERALAWVDARYQTALLWANDPGIYGRFGFVAREESMFVGPVRGGPVRARALSLEQPGDVALLREHLDELAEDEHAVPARDGLREDLA